MLKEVKDLFARTSATFVEDAVGVVTIFAVLAAALYLPNLV